MHVDHHQDYLYRMPTNVNVNLETTDDVSVTDDHCEKQHVVFRPIPMPRVKPEKVLAESHTWSAIVTFLAGSNMT